MAVISEKIKEYQKKIQEYALAAEKIHLKKIDHELEKAKENNDTQTIQRILAREKNLIGNPRSTTGGIMGFIRGLLDLLKKNKDSSSVAENLPQDTIKPSLQQFTQNIELDTDFTEVDKFIDSMASDIGRDICNKNFQEANIDFPNDVFKTTFIQRGNDYLSTLIKDVSAADYNNVAKKVEINSLSLSKIISSIFEYKAAQEADELNEAQRSELAVKAITKAYVANKFLKKEKVSQAKLIRVAENAARQVKSYLKIRQCLDNLYKNVADNNDATAKEKFEAAKKTFSYSALGLEFLNNMSYANKIKYTHLNKKLTDKLGKLNKYYEKEKLIEAAETNDEHKNKLRTKLMFCLKDIQGIKDEVDTLQQEARREKSFTDKIDKKQLQEIIENYMPLTNEGKVNNKSANDIQKERNKIIEKLDTNSKKRLLELEKAYADLERQQSVGVGEEKDKLDRALKLKNNLAARQNLIYEYSLQELERRKKVHQSRFESTI